MVFSLPKRSGVVVSQPCPEAAGSFLAVRNSLCRQDSASSPQSWSGSHRLDEDSHDSRRYDPELDDRIMASW